MPSAINSKATEDTEPADIRSFVRAAASDQAAPFQASYLVRSLTPPESARAPPCRREERWVERRLERREPGARARSNCDSAASFPARILDCAHGRRGPRRTVRLNHNGAEQGDASVSMSINRISLSLSPGIRSEPANAPGGLSTPGLDGARAQNEWTARGPGGDPGHVAHAAGGTVD